MSNLNDEQQYETITEALAFIFDQRFKGIYTCLPGVIVSYDQSTKRAAVQPALRRILTDGTEESLPIVQNVPVCFPTGGGFSLLFPVTAGDTCILLFSQRGIQNFKETYTEEAPDEGLLDLNDAIAIMGFGPLSVTPASASGASLQSDDGADTVTVEPGKITITTTGDIEMNADNVNIISNTLTHNGTTVGEDHIHSQGDDSDGDTEADTGTPHT